MIKYLEALGLIKKHERNRSAMFDAPAQSRSPRPNLTAPGLEYGWSTTPSRTRATSRVRVLRIIWAGLLGHPRSGCTIEDWLIRGRCFRVSARIHRGSTFGSIALQIQFYHVAEIPEHDPKSHLLGVDSLKTCN